MKVYFLNSSITMKLWSLLFTNLLFALQGPPPPGQGPPGMPMGGPPPHGHPHHPMMGAQGPPMSHGGPPGHPGHLPPSSTPGPAPPSAQAAPVQAGPSGQPSSGQTPPHSQGPPTNTANGAPQSQSPMQGALPGPGPDNLIALQRAIDAMEEKGLQEDPRYSQLLAMRARSNPQDPNKQGLFSNIQLSQLK